jgi:hypothetical protein
MQLSEVVASRRDQSSYHVFSEENARGEIFNLGKGEQLRPMKCNGNVLLIPIEGRIKVILNGEEKAMAVGSGARAFEPDRGGREGVSSRVPQESRSGRAKTESGWRAERQPLDVYREFWRARQDLNPRPPGS